jgi:hypothetical protein
MSDTLTPLPEVEADPDHAKALARAICLERYPRERSEGWTGCPDLCATCRAGAAAVVRLLADQVVPEIRCPIPLNVRPFVLGLEQRLATRAEMLAIVTELKGHHD